MSNVIDNYLKYANLQMAAESLFGITGASPVGSTSTAMNIASLMLGDERASRFTTAKHKRIPNVQAIQEQSKASQREKLTTLTAPVDGDVQQLAIHTSGGVATEPQYLMVIVPDGAQVTAEVTMENKDVGFVTTGQSAEIKSKTFPFTRYGTVARDSAVGDGRAGERRKEGAIFPATLSLKATQINVNGISIRLSPRMNLRAEIKTGQRRVIEFLLSPIQRAGNKSLRERWPMKNLFAHVTSALENCSE
jgi:hemolysin D